MVRIERMPWVCLLGLALLGGGSASGVDFRREILPLLSDRCFHCHGPDEHSREAGLRLDVADSAVESGAIIAGEPNNSSVVERVFSQDADLQMPPPDSNKQLSDKEKQLIRQWIAEGAKYEKHWSFVRPEKQPTPEIEDPNWATNEIDRFIAARLDNEDLKPQQRADRFTLIRRLSLDLTGLPPSTEEARRFANDRSPDAYQKLVERLLASPHFGERMALVWLDAARYADTNGYSIDGGRHVWLWRDWVINSFNENKPYDEFLLEQLAGDLLPNPTDAQLIATGMQRNNMVTHEGGTIPAENLANYNADRVKTLGEAVLGLTIACAQCHDHKYDPLTQRDYYRLFAFFNTISDKGLDGNGGVNPRPYFTAKTVLQTGEEQELQTTIDKLKQALANPDAQEIAAWEAIQRKRLSVRGEGLKLHPIEPLRISTPNSGSGFTVQAPKTIRISSAPGFAAYDVLMRLPEINQPMTGIRVLFLPDKKTPGGGLGHGKFSKKDKRGTFMLTTLSVSADKSPGDQVNLHRLIEPKQVTASSWRRQHPPGNVTDPRRATGWAPASSETSSEHVTYTFDKPIDAAETPYLTVQLNFGNGRRLVGARMEVHAMTGTDDGSDLPPEIIAVVQTPESERTVQQRELLSKYFADNAPTMQRDRVALANAKERLSVLTKKHSTMVMAEAKKPRATHILNRGDYSQPGERVSPGTPGALPQLPDGAAPNRLGLANWVVDAQNPLTSRVAVNRIWQVFFGSGIVRTSSDFGLQGAYPTHPELLDWLAVDFVQSGWDVKQLVRKIVHSSTYRQTSIANDALLVRDPLDELHARGPRFRLPAEFIRDAALKTSGLLVDRIGGPSVNPYTPGDLWREVSHYGSTPATAQAFVQDHGEKLYRRSLYTYWKRTVPPPNLAAFDAPSRETCVVSRPTTNTPLQALVLLNDVQFVEAARALAERMIAAEGDDRAKLDWAVAEVLSRPAADEELDVLLEALTRERQRYAKDPAAAQEFLCAGESPRDELIAPKEHAAWAQVGAMLINLSEAISRN